MDQARVQDIPGGGRRPQPQRQRTQAREKRAGSGGGRGTRASHASRAICSAVIAPGGVAPEQTSRTFSTAPIAISQ